VQRALALVVVVDAANAADGREVEHQQPPVGAHPQVGERQRRVERDLARGRHGRVADGVQQLDDAQAQQQGAHERGQRPEGGAALGGHGR